MAVMYLSIMVVIMIINDMVIVHDVSMYDDDDK